MLNSYKRKHYQAHISSKHMYTYLYFQIQTHIHLYSKHIDTPVFQTQIRSPKLSMKGEEVNS